MPVNMDIVMVMVSMKSNIAKGIIGNGLAQITLKVIRVLDQLLLVPFFISFWGTSYYGEWLTLSIIPAILGFSDLGVGTAASNSFVLAYVAGDRQQAANIRKTGFFIIFLVVLVGTILTFTFLYITNVFNVFDKTLIPSHEVVKSVLLLMVAKLIYFFNHLTVGYFRSVRKAALAAFMQAGYSVANILTGLCVLLLGGRVVEYAFSQFVVTIIYSISFFLIGNKIINLMGFKGYVLKSDVKHLLKKGFGYMMNPIWNSIFFQGSTLVVRMTLGAESVAAFNTMRTASRSVSQLFNVVNASVFPELQYEYGKGNIQIVHRLFRLSILTSLITGVFGTILLSLFGMDIYNIWTQNSLSVSNEVWNTFVIGVFFNGIWWTSIVAYSVTNKPYHFAVASILTACLSVVVSYYLSLYLDLLGAVLGITLFDLIMMLYILPDSCSLLGMKTKEIFTHINEDYSLIKNRFVR